MGETTPRASAFFSWGRPASGPCLYGVIRCSGGVLLHISIPNPSDDSASVPFFFGAGWTFCYSTFLFTPRMWTLFESATWLSVFTNRHSDPVFIFGCGKSIWSTDRLQEVRRFSGDAEYYTLSTPAPVLMALTWAKIAIFPVPPEACAIRGSGTVSQTCPKALQWEALQADSCLF